MRERIIEDMQKEVDSINESLQTRRTQHVELEKAVKVTEREISLLEGRLAEAKAVVEYITNLSDEPELQIVEEPQEIEE